MIGSRAQGKRIVQVGDPMSRPSGNGQREQHAHGVSPETMEASPKKNNRVKFQDEVNQESKASGQSTPPMLREAGQNGSSLASLGISKLPERKQQ